jgi:hypothetical protein
MIWLILLIVTQKYDKNRKSWANVGCVGDVDCDLPFNKKN